jgi:hypothetical protein
MLDDAERGRSLEQPAGEDLAPGQGGFGVGPLFDEDLDECSGFLWLFPRQGAFTGCQPHHHVANPPRLARLEHDVAGQVVALVEQPERCDPVLDRGAIFAFDSRGGSLGGNGIGNVGGFGIGLIRTAAGDQRQHGRQGKDRG